MAIVVAGEQEKPDLLEHVLLLYSLDLDKSCLMEKPYSSSVDRSPHDKKGNKNLYLLSLTRRSKSVVVEERFAMQDLNLDNTVDYSLTPLNRSPASDKNSVCSLALYKKGQRSFDFILFRSRLRIMDTLFKTALKWQPTPIK